MKLQLFALFLACFSLIQMVAGCASNTALREAPAEYTWQIQQLIKESSHKKNTLSNLHELGVLYLRSGQFLKAETVFAKATELDRANSKSWFYLGLSSELMNDHRRALNTYLSAPGISSESLFSHALKGRVRILQERFLAEGALEVMGNQENDAQGITASYAILPLVCDGLTSDIGPLGDALSAVISFNIDQLQGVDAIDLILAKKGQADLGSDVSKISDLFAANKVIHGNCEVSNQNELKTTIHVFDAEIGEQTTVEVSGSISRFPDFERNIMNALIDELNIFLASRERRLPITAMSGTDLALLTRALELEEAERLQESSKAYDQLVSSRPGFTFALTRKELVENKILAAGTSGVELVDLVMKLESRVATPGLLSNRSGASSQITTGNAPRNLPPGSIGALPLPPVPTGN